MTAVPWLNAASEMSDSPRNLIHIICWATSSHIDELNIKIQTIFDWFDKRNSFIAMGISAY